MWVPVIIVLACIIVGIPLLIGLCAIIFYIIKIVTRPEGLMCKCTTRLDGKIAIVTGGNAGIGFETAKELAKRGARVIIADVNNADASVNTIIRETNNCHVEYRHLNLADLKNVKAFAEDFNSTVGHLDILINNAGCLADKKQITKDGIDLIMQVNYFGPFLLTKLLLEKINKRGRIVIVSSSSYNKGNIDFSDLCGLKTTNYFKSYMNSKLCTVLWTKALSKKLPEDISVFCLHPGAVDTNIMSFKFPLVRKILSITVGQMVKTPLEGAQTSLHLSIAPGIEHYTGGYFTNCKLTPTVKLKNEDKLIEELWNETTQLLTNRV